MRFITSRNYVVSVAKILIIGLCVFSIMMLSGCVALGPDYEQPKADVESNWLESEDPRITSLSPADPKWWKSAFNEPVLDQLIETAFEQNFTLRSARHSRGRTPACCTKRTNRFCCN